MTVRELIERLENIEDDDLEVVCGGVKISYIFLDSFDCVELC